MFSCKEMKKQNNATAFSTQKRHENGAPGGPIEAGNLPGSTRFLQRNLGNSYMQSIVSGEQTSGQITTKNSTPMIQRKCSCGGNCGKEDEDKRIQTKLKIGPVNDVYEQEADRVAEKVMRMPGPKGQAESDYPSLGMQIQRLSNSDSKGSNQQINLNQSGGRPLSINTRNYMEPRFGVDFNNVRLHTDQQAHQTASQIQAKAFTFGSNIWLGKGESEQNKKLMAHELTHVVQQLGSSHYAAKSLSGSSSGASKIETAGTANPGTTGSAVTVSERVNAPLIQGQGLGTLGCGLIMDPNTGTPICINHGGCAGNCVLQNRLPLPPICTCDNSGTRPSPPLFPGPTLPTPGLPTPGLPIPGPTLTPPAPAAVPPPTITGLTVTNQAAAVTYEEPGPGGPHFVTAASRSGPENVIVEATTDRPLNAGETITWTIDPATHGTVEPGNQLRVLVPKRRARHVRVTATSGGTSRSLHVWAVFASIRNVNGPTLGFSPPNPRPAGSACQAGDFCVWATVNFDARIFPHEIITDAHRPNLAGARTVAPSGGTHPCGNPLAGGAPLRWDFSRQVSFTPSGIIAASCGGGAAFPNNNSVGNDDSHAGDEMNDPYAGGTIPTGGRAVPVGSLGDSDTPSLNLSHAAHGSPGDTATLVSDFREFVRLEYHRTWWLISHRPTWGVRFRLRKNAANNWIDDGSAVV